MQQAKFPKEIYKDKNGIYEPWVQALNLSMLLQTCYGKEECSRNFDYFLASHCGDIIYTHPFDLCQKYEIIYVDVLELFPTLQHFSESTDYLYYYRFLLCMASKWETMTFDNIKKLFYEDIKFVDHLGLYYAILSNYQGIVSIYHEYVMRYESIGTININSLSNMKDIEVSTGYDNRYPHTEIPKYTITDPSTPKSETKKENTNNYDKFLVKPNQPKVSKLDKIIQTIQNIYLRPYVKYLLYGLYILVNSLILSLFIIYCKEHCALLWCLILCIVELYFYI